MKWHFINYDKGNRTRAMNVPGGVLIRTENWEENLRCMSEALCFVPGLKFDEDQDELVLGELISK